MRGRDGADARAPAPRRADPRPEGTRSSLGRSWCALLVLAAASWAPPAIGAGAERMEAEPATAANDGILAYGADPTGEQDSAAAINAALAARRRAYAPCGTYLLRRSVLIPSGGALVGAGRCTVFVVASVGFSGERVITNADVVRGNSDVTISDFSIRVRSPRPVSGRDPGIVRFQKVDGLRIERIRTDRSASEYDLVHLVGVRNATVAGCVLSNAQRSRSGGALGIYGGSVADPSFATHDVRVTGNRLESAFDEAVAVYGWFTRAERVTITRNTIVNRGPTELAAGVLGSNLGQPGVALDVELSDNTIVGKTNILTGASQVRFVRNTVTGPVAGGEDAVFIAAANGSAPHDVLVSENRIVGASRYGIFSAARDVTVRRNLIRDTRSYGVYGASVVADNTVSHAGGIGLFPTDTSSVVRGNTVVGSSVGIAFVGPGRGLTIAGNTIVDATSEAIAVDGRGGTVAQFTIVGNVVKTTTGALTTHGVRTANGTFVDCVVSRNAISGTGTDYVLAAGWRRAP